MEINIPLLINYCRSLKQAITINISLDDPGATLVIIAGESPQGSLRVFLDFSDINNILILNGVVGEVPGSPSSVQSELELARENPQESQKRISNIENLIYGTLANYISQMLIASHGKNYFPDLLFLEKHKVYFPSIEG